MSQSPPTPRPRGPQVASPQDAGVSPREDGPGDPLGFGNYVLKRKLGVGGMAETVVAVRHGPGGFEQEVCLKRILPAFALDERFVEMFLSEARLAARLRHNNVVQVYDFGEDHGVYYLALELVDGLDFRGLLSEMKRRGKRLPVDLLMYLIYELLAALSYAHNLHIDGAPAGLVHRDVTPSNVLISVHGEVKLTDFGIAKATRTNQATQTGSIKGKIPYMSPEQAQGERVDQRTDLFAVGVIVYEALAGKRPFDGPTDTATLLNIARGSYPPIQESVPDVHPALQKFVSGLLMRQPADRIQSAREAADLIVDLVPPPFVRRKVSELVSELRGQRPGEPPEATRVAGDPDVPQAEEGKATTTSGVRASEDPPGAVAGEHASGTLLGSGPAAPAPHPHAEVPPRKVTKTEMAEAGSGLPAAAATAGSVSAMETRAQEPSGPVEALRSQAPGDALTPPFQITRAAKLAAFVIGMMLVASGLTVVALMQQRSQSPEAQVPGDATEPVEPNAPELDLARREISEAVVSAPAPAPNGVGAAGAQTADGDSEEPSEAEPTLERPQAPAQEEVANTKSQAAEPPPLANGETEDPAAARPVLVKVSVSPHGQVWVDRQNRGSNSVTVRLRPGRHLFQAGISYPLVSQVRRIRPGRRQEVRLTIPPR